MKRTKTKKRIIVIAVIVIGILSLIWFFWLNPKKALNLALPNLNELSYVNAKIQSDTAYIDVIGVLENKAPYKISIDSLVCSLELADTILISERQKLAIEQSSGQKDTVVLTFRIPISKTRTLIQNLQKKDSTNLTANIEITYNTIFGRATIPFSKDFDIKVPTPPEIKLNKVKAGELNLKQKNIDIALDVSIINHSEKIELRLQHLVYDARIGKHIAGKGKYDKLIVISPNSSVNVVLPINVIVDKPFEAFWKIVAKKDEMNYEINLDATMINDTLQDVPLSLQVKGKTQLLK